MRERNQIRGILGIPVRSTGLWVRTLIEFALQKAGWQAVDWNGPGQIEKRSDGRSLNVGRGLVIGNVNIGIDLDLRAEPSTQATIWDNPTAQAAGDLAGGLKAAGIEARFVWRTQ